MMRSRRRSDSGSLGRAGWERVRRNLLPPTDLILRRPLPQAKGLEGWSRRRKRGCKLEHPSRRDAPHRPQDEVRRVRRPRNGPLTRIPTSWYGEAMTESHYRWVIVAAGSLLGCVAIGAMFSLPV